MDRTRFIFNIYLWVVSAFFLSPWLYIQYQTSVNSDVAWLSICAQRLIASESLSQACFDTNPPLSILVYAPFILISKFLSVEIHNSLFWGVFILTILFTLTTHKILKSFNIFSENEKFIISLGFLCSLTIVPTIYFAERDHIIGIALLPFILTQLCITYGHRIPLLPKYFTIIAGALALLIKPHFGLIPLFLFIYRMIVLRSVWCVIKSPDFIILSVLSIGYICAIYLFFNDFISVILPDILRFYLHYNNPQHVFSHAKIYGFTVISLLALSFIIQKGEKRNIILALTVSTLLCLTVFIIQMKGFTYHRLPMYSLLFPLGYLLLYNLITTKIRETCTSISFAIANFFLMLIIVFSYNFSHLLPDYPTHQDYINNDITNYINKNCDQPCSYFMTHENMDISSQLAFYSGHQYATRFPTFWFQPAFDGLVPISNTKGQETIEKSKIRYANYIAVDIDRMAPSLLLIQRARKTEDTTKPSTPGFIEYYSVSPKFKNVIARYKKIDYLTVDRAYFYKGTKYDFEYLLTWDVYKKDIRDEQ